MIGLCLRLQTGSTMCYIGSGLEKMIRSIPYSRFSAGCCDLLYGASWISHFAGAIWSKLKLLFCLIVETMVVQALHITWWNNYCNWRYGCIFICELVQQGAIALQWLHGLICKVKVFYTYGWRIFWRLGRWCDFSGFAFGECPVVTWSPGCLHYLTERFPGSNYFTDSTALVMLAVLGRQCFFGFCRQKLPKMSIHTVMAVFVYPKRMDAAKLVHTFHFV